MTSERIVALREWANDGRVDSCIIGELMHECLDEIERLQDIVDKAAEAEEEKP